MPTPVPKVFPAVAWSARIIELLPISALAASIDDSDARLTAPSLDINKHRHGLLRASEYLFTMDLYLNDSVKSFEFVLKGDLAAGSVRSLELAWITATSILGSKEVSVDVSGLTAADDAGVELLDRMIASGVRMRAALPPESEDLLRSLGIPVAAPARRDNGRFFSSLGRLFGFSA